MVYAAMAPVRMGVFPVVPKDPEEFRELRQDLDRMGCEGFLDQVWNLRHTPMVEELVLGVDKTQPIYKETVRAQPSRWTVDTWREVYGLARGGAGMATKAEKFVSTKFRSRPHRHDGYAIEECKDPRERRMLQFMVPILHPKKPKSCPGYVVSTILSSFAGEKEISWGKVIRDVVKDLADKLDSLTTPTPICPFLFHLYNHIGALKENEIRMWDEAIARRERGEPDEEAPASGDTTEDEDESGGDEEEPDRKRKRGRALAQTPAFRTRSKIGPGACKLKFPDEAGASIVPAMEQHKNRVAEMERTLLELVRLGGGCAVPDLVKTFKEGSGSSLQVQRLERQMAGLTLNNTKLKAKVVRSKEEREELKQKVISSVRGVLQIKAAVETPGELHVKARLWDAKVSKGDHISKTRLTQFVATYTAQVEAALQEMRNLLGAITYALAVQSESSDESGYQTVSEDARDGAGTPKGKEPIPVSDDSDGWGAQPDEPSSAYTHEAASSLRRMKEPAPQSQREEPLPPADPMAAIETRQGEVMGQPATHFYVASRTPPPSRLVGDESVTQPEHTQEPPSVEKIRENRAASPTTTERGLSEAGGELSGQLPDSTGEPLSRGIALVSPTPPGSTSTFSEQVSATPRFGKGKRVPTRPAPPSSSQTHFS